MKNLVILILIIMMLGFAASLFAQDQTSNKFGKGMKIIAKDSSFSVKFGVRIQSLYSGTYNTETKDYSDQLQIRRARLKFDGFAYSPKLSYKIELGISNRDMGSATISQTGRTASVILDAVLKYEFHRNWSVWFGQTKLPGNIERVVSSGALQFVDRSNLNSAYNIDRDLGLQLHYEGKKVRLIGAISTGEGRNVTSTNAGGYDYTQRIEWLPWGEFAGKGDYYESDLKREQHPRLILGLTHDFNDRASREQGQLGDFLTEQRSLETWFFDAHFKYNGLSVLVEHADKTAKGGSVIVDDNGDFVESFYVGTGTNYQAGYLFKNNFEIAGRYTEVNPRPETGHTSNQQYTLGLSKYVVGHSLKIQADATLIQQEASADRCMYRFQIDFSL